MKNPYQDPLNYSALPPQVAQSWTNGHHPLHSLNDPHALEDTGNIIMKVLHQQMGATMCVAVLTLPHLKPQRLHVCEPRVGICPASQECEKKWSS